MNENFDDLSAEVRENLASLGLDRVQIAIVSTYILTDACGQLLNRSAIEPGDQIAYLAIVAAMNRIAAMLTEKLLQRQTSDLLTM